MRISQRMQAKQSQKLHMSPQVQQSIGRLPHFDVTSACAIHPHIPEGDRDSEAS